MKKRILSVLMTIAMLLSLLPFLPLSATAETLGIWTDYAATEYNNSEGDGSYDHPFEIATAGQLALLAKNTIDSVSYSYGKYFVLTTDIDLSGHYWQPLGTFQGSLDGQGHVISNMNISSNADEQGLIAQAGAGVVLKHLTLEACDIKTTGSFAGALVARFEQPGTFTALDCHASGQVTGHQYVGGLFGQLYTNSGPLITDCSSSCDVCATVTGTGQYGFAGGLIGRSLGVVANPANGIQLSGCYAKGAVSGKGCIGGLVGESSGTAIVNCYATGTVTDTGGGCASGFVGLGYNTTVASCYTSCSVITSETLGVGGIIGNASVAEPLLSITNSYYTGTLTGVGGTSMTSADMKLPGFVDALNNSQSPTVWASDSQNINGGLPILVWQAIPAHTYWIDYAAPDYAGGTGTQDDPYLIASAAQLALLAKQAWTNEPLLPDMDASYFAVTRDKYYKITEPIDLAGQIWVPIAHFAGHLDGGGHIISNMETDTNQRFSGLISIADSADIKNVGLFSLTIQADDWSGALVAWINGVIGKTSVTGCFSTGTISTVKDTVGGLIGWARNADIENCYSTCTVSTPHTYSNAGGLLGNVYNNVTIRNCYAAGIVNASNDTENRAGGLIGGFDSSPAVVVNSYYNASNPAGRGGSGNSGTPLPISSTSGALDMMDADFVTALVGSPSSGIWQADSTLNGGFPILKWQAGTDYVCQIGTTGYINLTDALNAVGAGQSKIITLLTDINYTTDIVVGGKSITFELNGHTLDVNLDPATGTYGMNVGSGGIVVISGSGEFNINSYGILVHDGGKATVTNVTSGSGFAVEARGSDSNVNVKGNITTGSSGADGTGAYANGGATITVDGSIKAGTYIRTGEATKNSADKMNPTTKDGYFTYTDGTSTVWVKNPLPSETFDIKPVNFWEPYDSTDIGWQFTTPTAPVTAHSGTNTAVFHSSAGQASWADLRQPVGDGFAIPGGVTYTLTFWMYHSSAYNNNDLINVLIYNDIGNGSSRGLFYCNGDCSDGDGWKQHTISLGEYACNQDVRIIFSGTSASGKNIYIDDIIVIAPAPIPIYSITIAPLTGGSITADPTSATAGTTINLTITPENGKQLKAGTLTYNDGSNHAITGTSFIMPAAHVTVSAEFENIPPVVTNVTAGTASLPSSGGTSVITVTGTNLSDGIKVTAFDNGTVTAVTGTTSGSATAQTATLTFPANTGSADKTYVIKVSLDGGSNWETQTASVSVSKPAAPPPSGGGTGVLGTSDTVQVKTIHVGGAVVNSTVIDAVGSSGNADAAVTKEVIDALLDAAKENGGTGRKDIVEVEIDIPGGVTGFTASIPKTVFSQLAKETDARFSLTTDIASISFDGKAVDAISSAAKGDTVVVTASKIDSASLTPEQQVLAGNRPVYDFMVTSGGAAISTFGGGFATVRVPYTLAPGENPLCIFVCCLTDSGTLEYVRGYYDAATKTVVFMTAHFSRFLINYNPVIFNDIPSGVWYENAVRFIAARGITEGTAPGKYNPNGYLTRGEFIVMLLKAYGISPEVSPKDNFSDAGNTYYTGYLAAAKRLNISAGIGGNMYAPNRTITRQEMFTLLYNALKALEQLPEPAGGKSLTDFSDSNLVETWATEAMKALSEADIISGSGGKLNPAGKTTRAELAQVLWRLLSD